VKSLQTVTSAKAPNVLHRIEGAAVLFANPDELLHRLLLLVALAQVALTNGFPDEF